MTENPPPLDYHTSDPQQKKRRRQRTEWIALAVVFAFIFLMPIFMGFWMGACDPR